MEQRMEDTHAVWEINRRLQKAEFSEDALRTSPNEAGKAMRFSDAPMVDRTEDEQIEAAAARILKRFKPAFEELAK